MRRARGGREAIPETPPLGPYEIVGAVLGAARHHLDLDLALVVETGNGTHAVRPLERADAGDGLAADDRRRLEEAYCALVLAGCAPALVPGAHRAPLLAAPDGQVGPDGGQVSVPITFSSGHVFGRLRAISRSPRPALDDDTAVLRLLAQVLAQQLEPLQRSWLRRCRAVVGIRDVIDGDGLRIVHQPIVSLRDGSLVGAEALARFPGDPSRAPDQWFRDAWAVGCGPELELHAVQAALSTITSLPPSAFLSVNISPQLPRLGAFAAVLDAAPLDRLVLELTEHSRLDDAPALRRRLRVLRQRGLRIAVDDAGAGFAGLSRILDLEPDFVKLDASLVRFVDRDPHRVALAAALVHFAGRIDSVIIAEGVEHQAQADVLRELGVPMGQGYLIGRPEAPVPA